MQRRTAAGLAVVALGLAVVVGVAVLGPTATCHSTSGEIAGVSPIEYRGVADGELQYSRDGGASVRSIPLTVLGVPAGFLTTGLGLFVLES
ncbi:hypothetical protein [Halococcus sp. IIIV-5B]|uniref:hypothetical protein n=1 Tax=Halococcus sp. IIIV-5B TaxID=2321230 RepID=UPI000E719136|nr:hypothetical protein [Halococcus sp. IIIV-5B]RJT03840.1 hypothetical protein D3261_10355 [Halococcus sp. IIIV-5B]